MKSVSIVFLVLAAKVIGLPSLTLAQIGQRSPDQELTARAENDWSERSEVVLSDGNELDLSHPVTAEVNTLIVGDDHLVRRQATTRTSSSTTPVSSTATTTTTKTSSTSRPSTPTTMKTTTRSGTTTSRTSTTKTSPSRTPTTTSSTNTKRSATTITTTRTSTSTTRSSTLSTTTAPKSSSIVDAESQTTTRASSTTPRSTTTTARTTTPITTTTTKTSTTTSKSATTSVGAVKTIDVTGMTYQNALLIAHNVHRANHSLPDLVWNANLTTTAQHIASSCVYGHNVTADGGGYGQNIGAGAAGNAAAGLVTNLMYNAEINYYPGPYGDDDVPLDNFHIWGHYSQLVWSDSTDVGCYTQYCPNGLANTGPGVAPYFTVCNYSPPGNYVGEWSSVAAPNGGQTVVIIGS